MIREHYYKINLNWETGRTGMLMSPDLHEKLTVATPPEFENGVENVWSPEHLFTASVVSCYMTTFLAIADNSKLEFTSFHCHAEGKLELVDGKYMMSEIILKPTLVITNETDNEKAIRVLQKADKACLISNSVKSKIIFQPEIKLGLQVSM
jgi:peroxiredoxin-like protein